jgi:hypothetical protein
MSFLETCFTEQAGHIVARYSETNSNLSAKNIFQFQGDSQGQLYVRIYMHCFYAEFCIIIQFEENSNRLKTF